MPLPTIPIVPSGLLDHIRERRAAFLPDTCIIRRAGAGAGVWNEATDDYTPPSPSTVYSGACRVWVRRRTDAATTIVADDLTTLGDYNVEIPYDETGVQVDDRVTFTSTGDGRLNGRTMRVTQVEVSSYNTGRVLSVEEST